MSKKSRRVQRVFAFSRDQSQVDDFQVKHFMEKAEKLGARVHRDENWSSCVTHVVIVSNHDKPDAMTTKVMCGLANAKWVLTQKFLTNSAKKKTWVKEEDYVAYESCLTFRQAYEEKNESAAGLPFFNMRALIFSQKMGRKLTYNAVIKAGGGIVRDSMTVPAMCAKKWKKNELNHVFMEPFHIKGRHAFSSSLNEFIKNVKDEVGNTVHFLHYKFIADFLKEGGKVETSDYRIMDAEKVNALENRNVNVNVNVTKPLSPARKRCAPAQNGNVHKKLKDDDIVTLDDEEEVVTLDDESDNEDDIEVLMEALKVEFESTRRDYRLSDVVQDYTEMCSQQKNQGKKSKTRTQEKDQDELEIISFIPPTGPRVFDLSSDSSDTSDYDSSDIEEIISGDEAEQEEGGDEVDTEDGDDEEPLRVGGGGHEKSRGRGVGGGDEEPLILDKGSTPKDLPLITKDVPGPSKDIPMSPKPVPAAPKGVATEKAVAMDAADTDPDITEQEMADSDIPAKETATPRPLNIRLVAEFTPAEWKTTNPPDRTLDWVKSLPSPPAEDSLSDVRLSLEPTVSEGGSPAEKFDKGPSSDARVPQLHGSEPPLPPPASKLQPSASKLQPSVSKRQPPTSKFQPSALSIQSSASKDSSPSQNNKEESPSSAFWSSSKSSSKPSSSIKLKTPKAPSLEAIVELAKQTAQETQAKRPPDQEKPQYKAAATASKSLSSQQEEPKPAVSSEALPTVPAQKRDRQKSNPVSSISGEKPWESAGPKTKPVSSKPAQKLSTSVPALKDSPGGAPKLIKPPSDAKKPHKRDGEKPPKPDETSTKAAKEDLLVTYDHTKPIGEDEEGKKKIREIMFALNQRFQLTNENLAISHVCPRTSEYSTIDKEKLRYTKPLNTIDYITPEKLRVENGRRMDLEQLREMSASNDLHPILEIDQNWVVSSPFNRTTINYLLRIGLLYQDDYKTCSLTYNLFSKYVFLHLTKVKDKDKSVRWEFLVRLLSAFNHHNNPVEINPRNIRDVISVSGFWTEVSNCVVKCIQSDDTALEEKLNLGPLMLLDLLTNTFQRDFTIWWKHGRQRSQETRKYPILYYILQDESKLLSNAIKTIIPLYLTFLKADLSSALPRRLITMLSLLLTHFDKKRNEPGLEEGRKVEWANKVAAILKVSDLSHKDLYIEVMLLQPSWLSAKVSSALLDPSAAALSITSLVDQLKSVSVADNVPEGTNGQNERAEVPNERDETGKDEKRKLLQECALYKRIAATQTHSIYRALCHIEASSEEFTIFKSISENIRKLRKEKTTKLPTNLEFESVQVPLFKKKIDNILKMLRTLRKFHDGSRQVDGEGAIKSLLFSFKSNQF